MTSVPVTTSPSCTYDPDCCFNIDGNCYSKLTKDTQYGVCGAYTPQCVYSVMDYLGQDNNKNDLFDTHGGVGSKLYLNTFYNPLIVAKRSKFCSFDSNYLPETGDSNLCSLWWYKNSDSNTTVNPTWGLNDDSVSKYCQKYKMNGDKPYAAGSGTADYMALNQDNKDKVDKICGCYTSTMACPGTTDPMCKGDDSSSASAYQKLPAYHFQAQLNENCPPISVCMQNVSVSPFSFIFGSKQQQSCTNITGSPQQLIMYMEFIVLFFCALFLISIFYTTSVLGKVERR